MTRLSVHRQVIGGVDTHKDTHHAAVIDAVTGTLLGDREFAATGSGYRHLLDWLVSFGSVSKIGVEGTGSYGSGLCRFLLDAGVEVIETVRPDRATRRLCGKSDPIDAITAARAVLAGICTSTPKPRCGPVESIRLLRAVRAGAVKAHTATVNQLHAVLVTAPQPLRESLAGGSTRALIESCARLRVIGQRQDPMVAAKLALRTLARRAQGLAREIAELSGELEPLIAATAPRLSAVFGIGPDHAGQFLTTAGDNPARIGSEAALARLCGAAPIPASSGTRVRHRLHRGGDRQANRALHMIAICRMGHHAPTRAYAQRRKAEGKTNKEIIRCLKRALVREIYTALRADFAALQST